MKSIKVSAALAAVLIMSGCAKDEPRVIEPPVVSVPVSSATEQHTEPAEEPEPSHSTAEEQTAEPAPATTAPATEPAVTEATTTATSAATVQTEPEPAEEPDPIDYGAYYLTEAQMEYVERSIFIGDSICKGFGTYNVISFAHVYANGSMGTRNFDEYTFTYGKKNEELHLEELLSRTEPELVFLSMGMNDINMIHPSDYHKNYARIVDRVLSGSEAVVYLCAMTPVRSNFTSNERIDYFNAELQALAAEYPDRVYYVDYGKLMLNDKGMLNNQLDGGDGIHLSPYAYRIALWEIYNTLNRDGTMYPRLAEPTEEAAPTEETVPTEESAPTEESEPTAEVATADSAETESPETESPETESPETAQAGIRVDEE